jgi:hypothetical protein
MRWSVAYGGYPHGWDNPFLRTDNPYEAIAACDEATPGHMQIVAIFDDNGEGEPLSSDTLVDRLAEEEERTAQGR